MTPELDPVRDAGGPDAPLCVARCDTALRLTTVNEAFAERLGKSAQDLFGKALDTVVDKADFAKLEPWLKRALAGTGSATELQLGWGGSGPRTVSVAVCPDLLEGTVTGCIVVVTDLSARHRYERMLYQREREFQTIVENSPDIVARLDRQARHLYINRAVETPFGLSARDFIGRTIAELGVAAHVAEAYASSTRAVFDSGRERAFNFNLRVAGQVRHYTARAIPEFDRLGQVESVLVITYDVTQRTEAQLERDALLVREKAARVQAEAAARARDEFLAIVSHELRSPLNGIQSWTHVLENYVGSDSVPVQRALAGIKLGVQQQVRLIEDLLDATLIMTGKLRLAKESVSLAGEVQAAVESVRALATGRHITLTTELAQADLVVAGDAARLRQIFWNLLSNAIKFTPEEGAIWVALEGDAHEARITVRDNGRGIPAEFLPYLFDPFRQADESSTRRAGGIGLGLTLVRRLTELHGGRVAVESAGENQGAQFTVFLPLRSENSADLAGPATVALGSDLAHPSLEGVRVRIIDDQAEARDSLTELLEQAGARVEPFASGREACEDFGKRAPNQRPDVLVCDIAMPDQDGYATLQKIREMERAAPRRRGPMPAVALTAFSQRDDKVRALASGFQVHLAKPVDPTELISLIAMLARENRRPARDPRRGRAR